jgi:hypothetical protein
LIKDFWSLVMLDPLIKVLLVAFENYKMRDFWRAAKKASPM